MRQLFDACVLWERGLDTALQARSAAAAAAVSGPPSSSYLRPSGDASHAAPPPPSAAIESSILNYRKALSSVYSIILVEDPVFAHTQNVEAKAWSLFYVDINEAKQVLSKAGSKASAAAAGTSTASGAAATQGAGVGAGMGATASGGTAPKAILSAAVVSHRRRLTNLIGSAESFFEKLVQRLWKKYGDNSNVLAGSEYVADCRPLHSACVTAW